MILTFYNKNLEITGIITQWKSLYFSNTYNSMGSFNLELNAHNNSADFERLWEYCTIDYDNENVYVITSVNAIGSSIVLTGFPATYIFSKRVSTTVISEMNAEQAMKKIVDEMSPWDNVITADSKGIEDVFQAQISDTQVIEYLQTIGQATDIGFRLVKKGQKLVFESFKPPINYSIKYSTSLKNVANLDYFVSENEFYNVAIVAGAGEGANRITEIATIGNPTGTSRRELYVDARNEQLKEGETIIAYRKRLQQIGLKKLVDQIRIETLSFFISNDDMVSLGDVVDVYLEEYKTYIQARVVEIETINEGNTTVKTIQIGTPIKTTRRVIR